MYTISQIHSELKSGSLTVRSLLDSARKAIDDRDAEINAFLEVFDNLDEDAERAQRMLESGEAGPLTGIPIAVKDNILIKGRRVSASSKMLENYVAPYDATAIAKLRKAGAVFVGRTNMDEFAMGGSTEASAYGATKNPRDTSRVPGGSSGGSAAAVAAGFVPVALGSDTGGSVRQPASFCGVVGLKPTYGAVSRSGLIAMGSSLDQIGSLTHSVRDAEIVFDAIKGKDGMDSTSIDIEAFGENAPKNNKTIGVPRRMLEELGASKDTMENLERDCKKLDDAGFRIKDIELPNISYSLPSYYILMQAEVSSNLARFDGVKYGALTEAGSLDEQYLLTRGNNFGREVRRRIMLGTYILSSGYYDAYYRKAKRARSLIMRDFQEVFESGVDAIAMPTTPGPAFTLGEKTDDPLQMYLQDVFTVPANIAGIPAISVPSRSVDAGVNDLPLGLHLLGRHGGEKTLFEIGNEYENVSA